MIGLSRLFAAPPAVPGDACTNGRGRRDLLGGLLLGGGAAALLPALPARAQSIPPLGRLSFNLIRKEEVIGQQTLDFYQAGDTLTVKTEAHVKVTMAMLTLYSLEHHETEHWKGGQFQDFHATTVKNGHDFYAQAWRDGDQVMARGTRHPDTYAVPPGALPTSNWNRAMLAGPMINTEDGRTMHPNVQDAGMGSVATAQGDVAAQKFVVTGDLHFVTWFTPAGEWTGLSFHADDGSIVTYQRT